MAEINQSNPNYLEPDSDIISKMELEYPVILPWVEQIDDGRLMFLGDQDNDLVQFPNQEWIDAFSTWESLISSENSTELIQKRINARASELPSEIEFKIHGNHQQIFHAKSSETIVQMMLW